jgi:thioredoxin reductase
MQSRGSYISKALVVVIGIDYIGNRKFSYAAESTDKKDWKNKKIVIIGGGTGSFKKILAL